jgi:hypothetical protein
MGEIDASRFRHRQSVCKGYLASVWLGESILQDLLVVRSSRRQIVHLAKGFLEVTLSPRLQRRHQDRLGGAWSLISERSAPIRTWGTAA